MVGCYWGITSNVNDVKWNSIPSQYDSDDLLQLRIKK